jgi:hypothetical protein
MLNLSDDSVVLMTTAFVRRVEGEGMNSLKYGLLKRSCLRVDRVRVGYWVIMVEIRNAQHEADGKILLDIYNIPYSPHLRHKSLRT